MHFKLKGNDWISKICLICMAFLTVLWSTFFMDKVVRWLLTSVVLHLIFKIKLFWSGIVWIQRSRQDTVVGIFPFKNTVAKIREFASKSSGAYKELSLLVKVTQMSGKNLSFYEVTFWLDFFYVLQRSAKNLMSLPSLAMITAFASSSITPKRPAHFPIGDFYGCARRLLCFYSYLQILEHRF